MINGTSLAGIFLVALLSFLGTNAVFVVSGCSWLFLVASVCS